MKETVTPFPPIDPNYVSKAREKFGNDVLLKVLSNLDARAFYAMLEQIDPADDGLADALIFDYASQVTYLPNVATLEALITAEVNLPKYYNPKITERRKTILGMAVTLKMVGVIQEMKKDWSSGKDLSQGSKDLVHTLDVRDALSNRHL